MGKKRENGITIIKTDIKYKSNEDSPIKNECDVFINGRMEDVIPLLVEELKKQQQVVQAG